MSILYKNKIPWPKSYFRFLRTDLIAGLVIGVTLALCLGPFPTLTNWLLGGLLGLYFGMYCPVQRLLDWIKDGR